MKLTEATVLTIIAESVFEEKLVDLIEQVGATSYSIDEVEKGRGRHGSRAGTIESEQNIKVFIVTSQTVADSILRQLTRTFLSEHGIKVYSAEGRGDELGDDAGCLIQGPAPEN